MQKQYSAYLQSLEWGEIRLAIFRRCKGICEVCNTAKMQHVHHRTYRHIYRENQFLEDLVGICNDCHNKLHRCENGGCPNRASKTAVYYIDTDRIEIKLCEQCYNN